jgi:hypothetical protein
MQARSHGLEHRERKPLSSIRCNKDITGRVEPCKIPLRQETVKVDNRRPRRIAGRLAELIAICLIPVEGLAPLILYYKDGIVLSGEALR